MKIGIILFIVALSFTVWFEPTVRKVSTPGYYKGTVVDLSESCGKYSCEYSALVDWDGLGRDAIPISAHEYRMSKVGARLGTQYEYVLLFGIAGTAYGPEDPALPSMLTFTAVLLRLYCFAFVFIIILATWEHRYVKNNT